MTHSRYNVTRKILIFWTLFIGIGAIAGAVGMISDPTGKAMGMDGMLPYFQKLPFADIVFRDLLFSGFALLIVNGLTNLTASVFLFLKKKIGVILGMTFGITLMLWICIQFYMFPMNFMSTIYFIFGICQFLTGYAALVFKKQEDFHIDISDYPNIGKNKDKLVVFFSRMGYVKKVSCEEANRTGAEILELKTTEKTDGTGGFWWCGRFALHKWDMNLEEINVDISAYKHITVCTPIWVFSVACPIRAFCRKYCGKIKEADYIAVHHLPTEYVYIAKEIDGLLKIKHTSFRSFSCKIGKMRELKCQQKNL